MSKTASNGPLSGQVAVITGAGRGIGAAIATSLADLGARAVLCGRSREALEAAAATIQNRGGQSAVMECDVRDLRSVEGAAQRVERTFNKLNILVNNAGMGGMGGPLHQLPPEVWDQVLNTNLRGVYYCIRSFAPLMMRSQGGHIINLSSLAGKNPLPNGAAYAASKWGLNGLSYSVAEELRAPGFGCTNATTSSSDVFATGGTSRPEKMSWFQYAFTADGLFPATLR